MARDFFNEEVIHELFGTSTPKVMGTRQFTLSEIAYADVLKRKYIKDDHIHMNNNEQIHETSPLKLNKKDLYYSKFSKPNTMKHNAHDELGINITKMD